MKLTLLWALQRSIDMVSISLLSQRTDSLRSNYRNIYRQTSIPIPAGTVVDRGYLENYSVHDQIENS